jgi:ComF family protein
MDSEPATNGFVTAAHLARGLWRGMLDLAFPPVCVLCQRPVSNVGDRSRFCPTCRDDIFTDRHQSCPRCAATIGEFTDLAHGCSRCRGERFAFDAVVRVGVYDGQLRELVLKMKSFEGDALSEIVAKEWPECIIDRLRGLGCDVVVAVPLHWRRRWGRGFNGCDILASVLANRLGLPCESWRLRRIRATPRQFTVAISDRPDNVRDAFRASTHEGLVGKSVLLVDDVLTTGSTAHESAKALRSRGAARVVVAILGRA